MAANTSRMEGLTEHTVSLRILIKTWLLHM